MTRSGIRPANQGGKTLLVLAANTTMAARAAEARGIPVAEVAFPRTVHDAERWAFLPLLIDWSLPNHPEAVKLDAFAAAYLWRNVPKRGWHGTRQSA